MPPQELIARYVHDVSRRLPREMRADVSAELRALLTEELEAKAGGAAPDAAAACGLLARFGEPAQVALNYHAPAPVIDTRDARLFGKLAAAILTALAILALSVALSDPAARTDATLPARVADEATRFGLQILGAMLVVFWAIGAVRRRRQPGGWSPRALPPVRDPDVVNRPLAAFTIAFWTTGLAILAIGPARLIVTLFGDAAPTPLIEAFTYDASFAVQRAPVLWIVLGLSIAMFAWQAVAGVRTRASRLAEAWVALVLAVVLFHLVLAGAVFAAEPANQLMELAMALFGAWGFIDAVSVLNREYRGRDQRPYADVTV